MSTVAATSVTENARASRVSRGSGQSMTTAVALRNGCPDNAHGVPDARGLPGMVATPNPTTGATMSSGEGRRLGGDGSQADDYLDTNLGGVSYCEK